MSLRARPGQRDAAVDALRAKVLSAARSLLAEPAGSALSIDAVAARAGVARSIVHNQFGSVAGLVEALWDELAAHGALAELPRAFERSDARAVLDEFIAIFGRFFDAERLVIRRVKGLAAFDRELARELRVRDEHRRAGLRRLTKQIAARGGIVEPGELDAIDVLFTLTAFETFDALAGPERSILDAVPAVQALVRRALQIPN